MSTALDEHDCRGRLLTDDANIHRAVKLECGVDGAAVCTWKHRGRADGMIHRLVVACQLRSLNKYPARTKYTLRMYAAQSASLALAGRVV
jgi:hypothetical protein